MDHKTLFPVLEMVFLGYPDDDLKIIALLF